MKTRIIKKSESKEKEYLILNPPYTVFGHNTINPSFSLIMKVGGLRKILDDNKLQGEDSLRIEIFSSNVATEYSFIRNRKDSQ